MSLLRQSEKNEYEKRDSSSLILFTPPYSFELSSYDNCFHFSLDAFGTFTSRHFLALHAPNFVLLVKPNTLFLDMEAENLEGQVDVVDDVRCSLEEALQLMEKIQDRGFLSGTFFARADQVKFDDLKHRIESAIARLTLSCSVDTAVITKAKFTQSENLRKKMMELGGPEKVAQDEHARKAFEQHMEASDALISASVAEARKDLRAIGEDVVQANNVINAIEAAQKEQILETQLSFRRMSVSQEETQKKLEGMTDSFMQLQQQNELQRLQNDMLKRQVDELKNMLGEVKDCMSKFPVPAKEPERMLVMNTGGLMHMTEHDAAFDTLQSICVDVTVRYGITSFFNMIGDMKQYTAAGYMPADAIPKVKSDGIGTTMSQQNGQSHMAINLCHLSIPRKVPSINVCRILANMCFGEDGFK